MKLTKRKQTYLVNKSAKVGELIKCPICGTEFRKKQYSQAFCCSQCKDKYWNAKGDRHHYNDSRRLIHLLNRIENSQLYSDDPLDIPYTEINECDFGQNEDFDYPDF